MVMHWYRKLNHWLSALVTKTVAQKPRGGIWCDYTADSTWLMMMMLHCDSHTCRAHTESKVIEVVHRVSLLPLRKKRIFTMEPAAAVENIRSIKYSHKSVHASALKKKTHQCLGSSVCSLE